MFVKATLNDKVYSDVSFEVFQALHCMKGHGQFPKVFQDMYL